LLIYTERDIRKKVIDYRKLRTCIYLCEVCEWLRCNCCNILYEKRCLFRLRKL